MQESDRQMLMEYWLYQLLQQGNRPLCYARPKDKEHDALVAFLLPLAEEHINDADCQITLDPGPPCEASFAFKQDGFMHTVLVPIENSGCQQESLLTAAGQVDRFWLFISRAGSQNISLYQVGWNPIID